MADALGNRTGTVLWYRPQKGDTGAELVKWGDEHDHDVVNVVWDDATHGTYFVRNLRELESNR